MHQCIHESATEIGINATEIGINAAHPLRL